MLNYILNEKQFADKVGNFNVYAAVFPRTCFDELVEETYEKEVMTDGVITTEQGVRIVGTIVNYVKYYLCKLVGQEVVMFFIDTAEDLNIPAKQLVMFDNYEQAEAAALLSVVP